MREQRLQHIRDFILASGSVSLDALCARFNVSKNTIRRDVDEIMSQGGFQKVYGGIKALNGNLTPFESRDTANRAEKEAIGRAAAQLIEDGDVIFIDSGTTTRYILDHLPRSLNATIISNSLDVLNAATAFEHLKLFVVGSRYQRETHSFVGTDAPQILERYNFTKSFLAATGISIENGLTNADPYEYELKRKVVGKTKHNYILVDASKFGQSTLLTYAELKAVGTIITSREMPEDYRRYCRDNGIAICFAETGAFGV